MRIAGEHSVAVRGADGHVRALRTEATATMRAVLGDTASA